MIMKESKSLVQISTCFLFVLLVFGAASYAQKKTADVSILEEIAGKYEFTYGGQTQVFVFSVKEGQLMGAPEGETQETLEPVEGGEMTFIGHPPDGGEIQFEFMRDEEGKITKCLASVPAMGIEAEGVRIKNCIPPIDNIDFFRTCSSRT
jgi:hypothetical protein